MAVYRRVRMRAMPSQNSSRLSLGTRMALCMTQTVPISYMSSGPGVSTRGSCCATTASVRFSPSDCTSATELGRPTVIGSSAPGKMTVSRTARTGTSSTGDASASAGSRRRRLFLFYGHAPSLASSALGIAAQHAQKVRKLAQMVQRVLRIGRIHTSQEIQVKQVLPGPPAQRPRLDLGQAEVAQRERAQRAEQRAGHVARPEHQRRLPRRVLGRADRMPLRDTPAAAAGKTA